jgi:hypothetical protein
MDDGRSRKVAFKYSLKLLSKEVREEQCAGFEVLTAVVTKIAIFWDIAQCNLYANQRFGGMVVHTRI